MAKISKFLLTFLNNLGNEEGVTYSLVPRNRSCGEPGDILLFNYKAKNKMYSEDRALLLTRPVVKNTQSGGLLLTGLTINLYIRKEKSLRIRQNPMRRSELKLGLKTLSYSKGMKRSI
jgi:hypothetical protein